MINPHDHRQQSSPPPPRRSGSTGSGALEVHTPTGYAVRAGEQGPMKVLLQVVLGTFGNLFGCRQDHLHRIGHDEVLAGDLVYDGNRDPR